MGIVGGNGEEKRLLESVRERVGEKRVSEDCWIKILRYSMIC